jgi:RNA polymerase sigma-70 factor (ECF subfamily)
VSLQDEFEAVAVEHLDAVHRMARRLSRNDAEADDLVQETYLRAFRAFARFELRGYGAKPWLLKILYNVFYTQRGKAAREPSLLDDANVDQLAVASSHHAELAELGASNVDWDHFDGEIKNAVEALQVEYRTVLLLWALEGLSYKEIADVCDVPVGTVMSRLYRARQQVGQRLASYASERNIKSERFEP